MIECTICATSVRGPLDSHNRDFANKHNEILQEKLLESSKVAQVVMKSFQEQKDSLLEAFSSKLKEVKVSTVQWKITDTAKVMQEHPKGQCISSPRFSLGGVCEVQVQLYPNGMGGGRSSKSGHYGIDLTIWQTPADVEPTLRVSSGNVSDTCTEAHGCTWKDFGRSSKITEESSFQITVELLSATRTIYTRG